MAVYTAIDDAGSFFNPAMYTGNGSTNAITGVGFQTAAVWIKDRGATSNHCLFDAVRGVNKYLVPNTYESQITSSSNNLDSFDSDGFTLGADDTGTTGLVNTNTNTYASWSWKAGTTTGIDTTSSTITPTSYSFDQTSGFSILAYTGNGTSGALLAHGLGAVPGMFITKSIAIDSTNWTVYNAGIDATAPEDYGVRLNTSAARSDALGFWNDTAPTSVNMILGDDGDVNTSSRLYIAYAFAPKQGYSKFGSFVGNGNADGPFVYTGFRPALVLIKNVIGTGMSWTMRGNGLNPFNPADGHVVTNTTAAEDTGKDIDILSNGFKARTTDGGVNNNGNTLVYGAWAEAPFVNSSGVPVNAR